MPSFPPLKVQFLTETQDISEETEEDLVAIKETLESTMGKEELEKNIRRCRMESERDRSVSICSQGSNGPASLSPQNSRDGSPQKKIIQRKVSTREESPVKRQASVAAATAEKEQKGTESKQYQEEKTETGKVDIRVYWYYIRNMGIFLFGGCFLAYILYQVSSTASRYVPCIRKRKFKYK